MNRPKGGVGFVSTGVLTYLSPRSAHLTIAEDAFFHEVEVLHKVGEDNCTAHRGIEVAAVFDRQSRSPVVTACNCQEHSAVPVGTQFTEHAHQAFAALRVSESAVGVGGVVVREEVGHLKVEALEISRANLGIVGRSTHHQVEVEVAEFLVGVEHKVGAQVLVLTSVVAKHTVLPYLLHHATGCDAVRRSRGILVDSHTIRSP